MLALLRARTKFDFRCYRKKMLTRRIERRMGLNHFDSIPEYLAFLRDHPDEVKQLVKDLFISVTSFFRDPEAFEELASEVIAPLVQSKEADSADPRLGARPAPPARKPIRWSSSCSNSWRRPGRTARCKSSPPTSIRMRWRSPARASIPRASRPTCRRNGWPASSRGWTKRPTRSASSCASRSSFAAQNLISDAPFSKLDLISCRNLLIYLEPEVQKKVVTLLHFALNEGGYLFLGPSETIGRQIDLFEPVSKKWRIFRRIGPSRPERVEFPIVAAARAAGASLRLATREPGGARPLNFAELTQRLLLEELGPAAVLINRKYEILYFLGPTSRYLDCRPANRPGPDDAWPARGCAPSSGGRPQGHARQRAGRPHRCPGQAQRRLPPGHGDGQAGACSRARPKDCC